MHFEAEDYKLAVTEYHAAFRILGDKGYAPDRYNAAIANAFIGQIDSAFFHLFRLAEKTKFLEYHIVINERYFEALKTDSRWTELLAILNPRNEVYNDSLAKVLLTIRDKDQKYRHMLDAVRRPYGEEPSDSFKSILKTMAYTDSMNLILVSSIIDQYGWLSQNEVGSKGNSALWLVIQHADLETQEKYLPIMRKAVENGKAKISELAYLEDRILMRHGKKQLYGTQYQLNKKTNQMELWEIEDPVNLNKRRESLGLPPM